MKCAQWPAWHLWLRMIFCLFGIGWSLCGGEVLGQDTAQAHVWWEKGRAFKKASEFDSAFFYFNRTKEACFSFADSSGNNEIWISGAEAAISASKILYIEMSRYQDAILSLNEILERADDYVSDDHPLLVSANTELGNAYSYIRDYSHAMYYLSNALNILENQKSRDHIQIIEIYYKIGNTYLRMRDYDLSMNAYKQALAYSDKYDSRSESRVRIIFNMGALYLSAGYYSKALTYTEKFVQHLGALENPNPSHQILAFKNMGLCLMKIGRVKIASSYIERAIKVTEEAYGRKSLQMVNILHSKAQLLMIKQSYEESISCFREALEILYNLEYINNYQSYLLLDGLSDAYNKMEMDSLSFQYGKESLRKIKEVGDTILIARTLMNQAASYSNLGNDGSALQYALRGLDMIISQLGTGSPELFTFYISLGTIYRSMGEYDKALNSFENAMECAGDQVSTVDHIGCYWSMAIVSKQQGYMDESIRYYLKAVDLLNQMSRKINLVEEQDQLSLNDIHAEIYPQVTELYYNTSSLDSSSEHLQSFVFAEKAKASTLSQGIRDMQSIIQANIPHEVANQENTLRASILYFTASERETRLSPNPDSIRLLRYQDSIFVNQRAYDSLLQVLERDYPDYYNLKYNTDVISVAEVQQGLEDDQALLEYLLGDSSLFVFVIRPDTYVVKKIPRDSLLDEQVLAFTEALHGCPDGLASDCDRAAQRETQRELGHWLYQQLIAPVAELLPNRLVIVPDGELGYLPFEALLTEATTANQPDLWPFWLRDKTISYAFSATLWREMKQREHRAAPRKTLLAIAPPFEGATRPFASRSDHRRGYFGPLEGTQGEVAAIQALLGGDLLVDTAATLANFRRLAQDYRILHLATHGKVMEDPRYSLLAFYGPQDSVFLSDTIQRGISGLYLADLYNLQLNADLVVLSACETGIGRLYRGEGIASLARGFTYAGAKSLVPSLWAVSDASTARLMKKFYQYLAEGMPKDSALRKAKLDLLGDMGDPYQWSAFVLMGDTAPIERRAWGWLGWVIGGIIVSLVGYVGWWRFRQEKRTQLNS